MNIKDINEKIIRTEFSDWINEVAAETNESKSDPKLLRRYYVYALCKQTEDGKLTPFYIGKGTGDRVWSHADETDQEVNEILDEASRFKLTEEEISLRMETLKAKNKVISEIGKENVEKIIVKSGLTEYESFMCESALINIFRLESLLFNDANLLTNKANGHSNQFEKKAEIETSAIPIEEYYNKYCKKPIVVNALTEEQWNDFSETRILFQCFTDSYEECMNTDLFPTLEEQNIAIREAIRGFWRQGDINRMDYVFAMNNGRIKGIYKVNGIFSILDINRSDYPWYDKLPFRKMENERVKIIYRDLIKHGMISAENHALASSKEDSIYSVLDLKTQDVIRDMFKKPKDYRDYIKKKGLPDDKNSWISFYDNQLINWTQRKYFVLEDLSGEEATKYNKYLNCSVKVMRGDDCDSIFSGKKKTDIKGKTKRAFSFSCRYIDSFELKLMC